jgi:hypothetical protein
MLDIITFITTLMTVHSSMCPTAPKPNCSDTIPTQYHIRSRVQKFPARDTKAAPNKKMLRGYVVPFEEHKVTTSQMYKVCCNKDRIN